MGAFTLIIGTPSPERDILEAKQAAAMTEQGFARPVRLHLENAVLCVYPKQLVATANVRSFGKNEFVAVVGTFFYKARSGADGLRKIHNDFRVPDTGVAVFDPLPVPIYGTYACIIQKGGQLWVFTDRLGLYKVYNADDRVVSSSFLAAVACTESSRLNSQAIFEYVFQGATYGDETVLENVDSLNPDYAFTLAHWRLVKRRRRPLAEPLIETLPFSSHSDRISRALDRIFRECIEAFEGRIGTALSGGYDSRLILAHLVARDVRPDVHVYGAEADADVQVARSIADAEEIPLTCVDKNQYQSESTDYDLEEIVHRNFYAFDGLPPDGIFDYGVDLATRRDRARNGAIALNGGGGEIFRNFFYLPDRSFDARQVVWTFYSQFDPRAFPLDYEAAAYQDRLGEKINQVLGTDGRRLSRAEIERIYPVFRCRYWMGRNNSLNNRLGLMHTPLVEPLLVEMAGRVPIRQKNAGRLAASLIRHANERLASYDSVYGHSFDKAPPWLEIVKEAGIRYRPPRVRQWSVLVKNILLKRSHLKRKASLAGFDALFPRAVARAEQFFRTDYILDTGQRNRLRTIGYFLLQLDP